MLPFEGRLTSLVKKSYKKNKMKDRKIIERRETEEMREWTEKKINVLSNCKQCKKSENLKTIFLKTLPFG